jgi:hypothetical protein
MTVSVKESVHNMTISELTALVFCGSLLAGLVGPLTGLGGGIIITPLLTLLLEVDIHYAIGAALVLDDISQQESTPRPCRCEQLARSVGEGFFLTKEILIHSCR